MNKALYILLLVVVYSFQTHAQRIQLTDTLNEWTIYHTGYAMPDYFTDRYTLKLGADTFLFGHTYKRTYYTLQHTGTVGGGGGVGLGRGYREDTVLHKAWCLLEDDSLEHLIYDGNWQVGDSIKWRMRNGGINSFYTISGIDSSLVSGQWHRVFHVQNYNSAAGFFDIIDGIGSSCGLAVSARPATFEDSWTLCSFTNAGMRPAISPGIGIGKLVTNTANCTLSVIETSTQIQTAIVVPNPINDASKIVWKYPIKDGLVQIYNMSGKVVRRYDIRGQSSIRPDLNSSEPGIYFYRIIDNSDGTILTGNFLIQ